MEKMRLAICDDESVVLSVVSGAIASAFKKKGIQVEVMTFRRAKDLEERMKEVEFQLLFLDIDMMLCCQHICSTESVSRFV